MKVSDKAVQSLRVLIEQSNMQVGDRLPAERKLCEQLQVSCSSLREAISQLTSMGMLVSKVGAGVLSTSRFSHGASPCRQYLCGSAFYPF